jgi:hypothetical protein
VRRSDVVLGPLAIAGGVLLGLGFLRRSWKLAAAGVAAIVADERLPAAQRLKDRLQNHALQA